MLFIANTSILRIYIEETHLGNKKAVRIAGDTINIIRYADYTLILAYTEKAIYELVNQHVEHKSYVISKNKVDYCHVVKKKVF